jgi:hypothetical protein
MLSFGGDSFAKVLPGYANPEFKGRGHIQLQGKCKAERRGCRNNV